MRRSSESKSECGARKTESGAREAESGGRKTETGAREAESGGRKTETGNRNPEQKPIEGIHFLSVFADVVREHGEKTAIEYEGEKVVSFDELDRWARSLAVRLTRELNREAGGLPGDKRSLPSDTRGLPDENREPSGDAPIVGLCLEKSAAYIAAMLACWYAGAAFVPVDPLLPADRAKIISSECGLKLAFSRTGTISNLAGCDIQVIATEFDENEEVDGMGAVADAGNEAAYVIFTSGSTGVPKGVVVPHRGIVNLLLAQIKAFRLGPGMRSLFFLSTNFDASISDIGTALLSGATLCIEPPGALQPDSRFADLIRKRAINYVDIPPSALKMLKCADMPECLQSIVIGGEACPPHVVREWSARFHLVNVYGPTEATVCTSLVKCDPLTWHRPLIGEPLPGIKYLILDDELKEVPAGTAGELYIGGISLASGYLNRKELTERKFPLRGGERLYRTGDRVVAHKSGEIEFVGRVDRQVKVRGMLIEPEEIEARLVEHPRVKRAAVVKRRPTDGTVREGLVAFLIGPTRDAQPPTASELRGHLLKFLPGFMLPNRYVVLGSFPETSTGKVDLSALVEMPLGGLRAKSDNSGLAGEFTSSHEAQMALEAIQEVLGVEEIHPDDDFFDLGGDSFAVLEAVVAAQTRGVSLSPSVFMTNSRITDLIAAVGSSGSREQDDATAGDAMTAERLRAEVQLDGGWERLIEESRLRFESQAPSESLCHVFMRAPQEVFLTGATGFLASRLLLEILSTTDATVTCLVRCDNETAGLERVEYALSTHGKTLTAEQRRRIKIVSGDVAKERFGIAEHVWNELTKRMDTVYHCAAQVNNLLSYENLKSVNIGGTFEIARFMACGRPKWLHYASTLSVFVATDCNTGCAMESDDLSRTNLVYGGYAQTKWASEVFLRSLGGAVGPVSHYRFGLIVGDSKTGLTSKTDFLTLFARGIVSLGCVPEGGETISVDITPVDYSAAAMAALSLRDMKESVGRTYHIANRESLALSTFSDALRGLGVPIETVPADAFLGRARNAKESAACLSLCRVLSGDSAFKKFRTMDLFQATGIAFDTTNTDEGLGGTGISCPKPDKELVMRLLAEMRR